MTHSIFFHVLRRMRAPLIALVTIYAVSVLGLALIPGVDAQGRTAPPLSIFHAFYFVSYTATTIGFGELPNAFSDAQRMWVTLTIYLSVVGWSYCILTLLALFQDRTFQGALATTRFERRVRRLQEPFYLVCGVGETGSLLCRALDQLGLRRVVIDRDPARLAELELEDFRTDTPTLAADAGLPDNLLLAGLKHPQCKAVIALTDSDQTNLAIAISTRLLNPSIPVLCRAERPETAANMASFGTNHIINPFEKFSEYLVLAMRAPDCYRLLDWLTGIPGTRLRSEQAPPHGRWIVCGYGRFGQAVARQLEGRGLDLVIIDPQAGSVPAGRLVCGLGTEEHTLRQAGVEHAVGIVAGTDNDVNNLSIVVTAREINPELFIVVRHNQQANSPLFATFNAHLQMVSREIIAHECLGVLTTPQLSRFLDVVRQQTDAWADALIERMQAAFGDTVPAIWSAVITSERAPAPHSAISHYRETVTLGELLRSPAARDERIAAVPLLVARMAQTLLLPPEDYVLQPGDEILFAGSGEARDLQALSLQNINALRYVRTGIEAPGGWVWQWLARRARERRQARA